MSKIGGREPKVDCGCEAVRPLHQLPKETNRPLLDSHIILNETTFHTESLQAALLPILISSLNQAMKIGTIAKQTCMPVDTIRYRLAQTSAC